MLTANVGYRARINASIIDTGFGERTVIAVGTLQLVTFSLQLERNN